MNPHQEYSLAPTAISSSVWRNRELIATLTKREVIGRYKGSFLGLTWSLLNPLLILTVFTFVFGDIFQSKWGNSQNTGRLDFASALFAGLLIYNFFAECISRSPMLITSNPNFVKKVIFPVEVLPVVNTLGAIFHLGVAYVLLGILVLFSNWGIGPTAFLVPIILLPFVLLTQGLSWLLAALGVFLRDISQLVQPGLTALLFLSPIFYPLSSVPQALQWVYKLNPITFTTESIRSVLIHHTEPVWNEYFVFLGCCLLTAWIGFALFQKTRKGFADVL